MLIHVPLNFIDDNPFQRRQDYGDVESLATDIAANGLLQMPVGRLLDADGQTVVMPHNFPQHSITDLFDIRGCRVQLGFGHRRKRAWAHLDTLGSGWTLMPVDVRPLDDDHMLNFVWSENQHRSDINPIEQAELLAEKLDRVRAAGGNQGTIASEWNLDRSTIANKLRLLDLPADVQTAVRDRRLSERQATALLPIVELQAKLNGADTVKWDKGKKPELYGTPINPAAFMAYVVANPDQATSDTIRDYSRRAADTAGRLLPDTIAKFDAGQGDEDEIVQPLCAGCPRRHNQHCLQPTCLNAKWERFKAGIPQLAADHAGLPWCDNPAAFPGDHGDAQHLRHLYGSSQRENLVVGWVEHGWHESWFTVRRGYQNPDAIRADWRNGLLLGRLPQPAPAAEDEGEQPPIAEWGLIRDQANNRRRARIHQALTDAVDRLLDDRADHLRPLLFLAFRSNYNVTYRPDQPVAEPLRQLIESTSRSTPHPYDSWAALFTAIGLDPALIAPTDEADALRELAADALIDWYRNRDSGSNVISQLAVNLGQAINRFEAAGITPADDDAELAELARWLPRAYTAAAATLNGRKPTPETL